MNVIVSIDDECGMLFAGRRQSKDRILRQQVRDLAQGQPLWMNSYTARQFAEDDCEIQEDEAFLDNAPADAWCFVENSALLPYLSKIEKVAVYRWNRLYPSDLRLDLETLLRGRHMISRREFPGSSHERITEEVYQF